MTIANPKKMRLLLLLCLTIGLESLKAQTDIDGIMMSKQDLCTGLMYNYSSWENYWEGTFKRNNQNLGTVSTQSVSLMGNYGIKDNLNFIFSVPYITTKASDGTMAGMRGLQDLSLFVKYKPYEKTFGKHEIALYAVGGFSMPVSNYVADYLPLSLGSRSKVFTARAMADYQRGKFFTTISGTYNYRNNIKIDRTSYYTTELHLTNEVALPNVISYNVRMGYRSNYLIAEAVFNNIITQGGFDIRKNDMPFVSNQMNMTLCGLNVKYTFKKLPALSLIAGGNTVIGGRNVGQATGIYGGAFYIINFSNSREVKN